MPEGPEIRRAADRIAGAIEGEVADEVEDLVADALVGEAQLVLDGLAVDRRIRGGEARLQVNGRHAAAHERILVRATEQVFFRHRVGRERKAFLADGRLDPAEWQLKTLSEPLPDVLLLAKGMGGGMVFDADGSNQRGNDRVPAGPMYNTPEWRMLFRHAMSEADRFGLEMGLSIQSGWNLGGPRVTP